LVLGEKRLPVGLEVESYWQRRPEFLAINPAGQVPVMIEANDQPVVGSQAIVEYLEELESTPSLLGQTLGERAETRRLISWFDEKFNSEVTKNLLGERSIKRFSGMGEPDSTAIRAGRENILYHLHYIAYLAERRNWLAGDHFSVADCAAAAHLSVLDYIGDVPWDRQLAAKDWYVRVKSRPSFRTLLQDRLSGLPPVAHYVELDS
jgi:glutathione S-transferase